jgi:hypothetical protein
MINRGIDDQISQRIMASGGNPQKLMQDYSRKKELLDLLALQRLKKQKEDTMRDMQLSLQNNPQTIKQQREAQVAELTKNELAQQVGQTMAQQQARSQQNVQRVAQAGLPNAPAPNMRMQNGGIVGFAVGDYVDADDARLAGEERRRYAELIKKARPKGKSFNIKRLSDQEKSDFERLNYRFDRQPLQAGIENFLNRPISDIPGMISTGVKKFTDAFGSPTKPRPADEILTFGQGTASGTGEEMNAQRVSAEDLAKIVDPRLQTEPESGAQDLRKVLGRQDIFAPTTDDTTTQPEQKPSPESEPEQSTEQEPEKKSGITAALPTVEIPQTSYADMPKISAGEIDYSTNTARAGLEKAAKDQMDIDVGAARTTGRDDAQQFLGDTEEEKAGIKALIDERRKIEQGLLDPEKLRTQQILSQLSGMAGSSTAGIAGARGTQASLQAQRAQEQAQQDLFEKRKADFDEVLDRSRAVREKAFSVGETRGESAETKRIEGQKTLTELAKLSDKQLQEQAQNELQASIANLDAYTSQKNVESRERVTQQQLISNTQIANAKIKSQEEIAKGRNEVQRETNRLMQETKTVIQEGQNINNFNNQLTNIGKLKAKIVENIATSLKNDFTYMRLKAEQETAKEKGNETEFNRIKDALSIIEAKEAERYESQIDDLNTQSRQLQSALDAIQFKVER